MAAALACLVAGGAPQSAEHSRSLSVCDEVSDTVPSRAPIHRVQAPTGEGQTGEAGRAMLDDVSGIWCGRYSYAGRNRMLSVDFVLRFEVDGERCRGTIQEPNTFGSPDASHLYATAVCQLDASAEPARLTFVKTYDGTGGVSHSVDYAGELSADRKSVAGAWRIPMANSGTFTLRRQS